MQEFVTVRLARFYKFVKKRFFFFFQKTFQRHFSRVPTSAPIRTRFLCIVCPFARWNVQIESHASASLSWNSHGARFNLIRYNGRGEIYAIHHLDYKFTLIILSATSRTQTLRRDVVIYRYEYVYGYHRVSRLQRYASCTFKIVYVYYIICCSIQYSDVSAQKQKLLFLRYRHAIKKKKNIRIF